MASYTKDAGSNCALSQPDGLSLRQNYNRKAPWLLLMASRYRHARQMQRKRKALKQLKTLVGRVYRDIERAIARATDRDSSGVPGSPEQNLADSDATAPR